MGLKFAPASDALKGAITSRSQAPPRTRPEPLTTGLASWTALGRPAVKAHEAVGG